MSRKKVKIRPIVNPTKPLEGRYGLILARISAKKQELEGNGLGSQEIRCKDKLMSLGIPYEKTFPYTQSGGAEFVDRRDMQALLEYIDARPGKNYVVAFDDLKRFARNTQAHLRLRMEFRNRDVLLVSPNFTFDDTEEGEFVETVLAAQGQLERKQNRRQVIQKQTARLTLGCWAFGAKKGYDMVKDPAHGKIGIPNRDGRILKEALEGFANGIFVRKIDVCRFLLNKGFWKTQKAEKYIDKVTAIIKDPYYAGYIEYIHPPLWDVARRPGHHQRIISPEIFELNQKRLSRVDLNKRIRVDTSPDFPLRGLIIHDVCKGHITSAWYPNGKGQRYPKYVCHTKDCPNYNKPFAAKDVENKFNEVLKKGALKKEVDIILQKMFDRVWKDEISKITKVEQDLGQEKRALEKKLSDLTDLMLTAKSQAVKRNYEKQIEIAADKLEAIEIKSITTLDMAIPYQTALEKATTLLKRPDKAWKKLNVHEQHSLFFFLFQEKLPYSITEGYQTSQIPYAARLFEDFAAQTTHLVEMPGVKPGSKTNSSFHYSQD